MGDAAAAANGKDAKKLQAIDPDMNYRMNIKFLELVRTHGAHLKGHSAAKWKAVRRDMQQAFPSTPISTNMKGLYDINCKIVINKFLSVDDPPQKNALEALAYDLLMEDSTGRKKTTKAKTSTASSAAPPSQPLPPPPVLDNMEMLALLDDVLLEPSAGFSTGLTACCSSLVSSYEGEELGFSLDLLRPREQSVPVPVEEAQPMRNLLLVLKQAGKDSAFISRLLSLCLKHRVHIEPAHTHAWHAVANELQADGWSERYGEMSLDLLQPLYRQQRKYVQDKYIEKPPTARASEADRLMYTMLCEERGDSRSLNRVVADISYREPSSNPASPLPAQHKEHQERPVVGHARKQRHALVSPPDVAPQSMLPEVMARPRKRKRSDASTGTARKVYDQHDQLRGPVCSFSDQLTPQENEVGLTTAHRSGLILHDDRIAHRKRKHEQLAEDADVRLAMKQLEIVGETARQQLVSEQLRLRLHSGQSGEDEAAAGGPAAEAEARAAAAWERFGQRTGALWIWIVQVVHGFLIVCMIGTRRCA